MGRLEGKVAVITGGNGSIGAAAAQAFLKEGAKVVVADRHIEGIGDAAKAAGAAAENWMAHRADAAERAGVDGLIAAALERFGRIDVFMAHAGSDNRRGHFFDLTDDDFDYLMNNNAKSVFMCSQAAAKAMAETGGGSIILTSSISALVGRPNSVVYGATKGAVMTMMRHMAHDLGRFNIRVNALAPGLTLTNQTAQLVEDAAFMGHMMNTIPMKRAGTTDDMTGALVFLASDESSYITGTHIVVDGGVTGLR